MFTSDDIYEGYQEDTEYENDCHTSFGESIPLSEYMEGVTNGFDIRHTEQQSSPDKKHGGKVVDLDKDYTDTTYEEDPRHRGVTEILHGFGEDESPEMNIYVQEILDVLGPDQGDGAGPYDVETKFILDDYIMFRTLSFNPPYKGKDGKWKKSQKIEFNYDPVNAIIAAEEIFSQVAERYEETYRQIQNRAVQIARLDIDLCVSAAYLNWAHRKNNINPDEPEMIPFEFHYEPVIEDQTEVNSHDFPGHAAADLGYMEGEEQRIKSEMRSSDCFKEDESGFHKELCGEEFIYLKTKKEDRIRKAQEILRWIEKHNNKEVGEMFRPGGPFKKFLQKNRSECLKPTGKFRTTFKSPYELWLTKEQVNNILKTANEKVAAAK
jgi:hypothetical protein